MSDDLLDLPPGSLAAVGLGLAHEVRTTEGVRSAEEAAEQLGVDADHLLKTLVVRRADDDFVFVLVPASRSLSWPKLRQHLGVSRLSLPDAQVAREVTGYERGAITPLGSSRAWPVVADTTMTHAGHVTIGSGHHGASLFVDADDLLAAIGAEVADVTDPT